MAVSHLEERWGDLPLLRLRRRRRHPLPRPPRHNPHPRPLVPRLEMFKVTIVVRLQRVNFFNQNQLS